MKTIFHQNWFWLLSWSRVIFLTAHLRSFGFLTGSRHSNQLHQSNDCSAGGEDRRWRRGKTVFPQLLDVQKDSFIPLATNGSVCLLYVVCVCVYRVCSPPACGWDLSTLTWLASHISASACRQVALCQTHDQSQLYLFYKAVCCRQTCSTYQIRQWDCIWNLKLKQYVTQKCLCEEFE